MRGQNLKKYHKNFDEIPKFQSLYEKFDIIPTYLLTYEYAIHKPAISFFLIN